MTNFKQYLSESTKEYDYKIKVAGDLSEDFAARLETALKKYEVKSLSKGKKNSYTGSAIRFPKFKKYCSDHI
jgi:hypothetical protein